MRCLCAENNRVAKRFWVKLHRMDCGFSVFRRKIINLRFADSHRPGGLEQINDKIFGARVRRITRPSARDDSPRRLDTENVGRPHRLQRRNREPDDIFLAGPIGKLILRFPRDTGMKGIHTDLKQLLKLSRIG